MYTQHQARFEEIGELMLGIEDSDDEPKKCKSVTVII